MKFFLKFEFLIYQALINAYINMSYKNIYFFSRKIIKRKRKSNISVSRRTLGTHKKINFASKNFLETVLLSTKFYLRLKKKNRKNIWNHFKITWKKTCVAIKKMLVIQFPYMGIV